VVNMAAFSTYKEYSSIRGFSGNIIYPIKTSHLHTTLKQPLATVVGWFISSGLLHFSSSEREITDVPFLIPLRSRLT
ncbi:MAG: hypothetical protein R8K20_11500, partial [Gallionellaceae bacterium]